MNRYRNYNGWQRHHNLHLAKMKVRFRDIKKRKRRLLLGLNRAERDRLRVMKKYVNYT